MRAKQEGKSCLLALIRNVELGNRDYILDTLKFRENQVGLEVAPTDSDLSSPSLWKD